MNSAKQIEAAEPMHQSAAIARRLLTIQEVAEYTGLSTHTLYTMVSQRRIPFVKLGRLTKFDRCEIDKWISTNSVKVRRVPHYLTSGS
jgi:excisionase family DNA binding protein